MVAATAPFASDSFLESHCDCFGRYCHTWTLDFLEDHRTVPDRSGSFLGVASRESRVDATVLMLWWGLALPSKSNTKP